MNIEFHSKRSLGAGEGSGAFRAVLPWVALVFAVAFCGRPGPDEVIIRQPDLFPEGVQYSSRYNIWLITSLRRGLVHQVKDDGTIKPLIRDDSTLVSTIGIHVDESRDRVLVANSDPGVGERTTPETQRQLAGLGIYRLSTGEKITYTNLGALRPEYEHFANDIALDGAGNAYVTDSYSPIIYKVTPEGAASVLIENSRFIGEGFGLNGIAFHRNNFLIVAKMDEGILFKVPLSNPDNFSRIELDRTLPGADGIFWTITGDLVVIANEPTDTVFLVKSTDGWSSGRVAGEMKTGDVYATTGVARGNRNYVLYARLNRLFAGQLPVEEFSIRKVKF